MPFDLAFRCIWVPVAYSSQDELLHSCIEVANHFELTPWGSLPQESNQDRFRFRGSIADWIVASHRQIITKKGSSLEGGKGIGSDSMTSTSYEELEAVTPNTLVKPFDNLVLGEAIEGFG